MSATLSAEEILSLTRYKRPADQLRELHLQGFYRARLAKVTGEVILERPHYDAVSSGIGGAANDHHQPKLRKARR
jgi:hypothetical protein